MRSFLIHHSLCDAHEDLLERRPAHGKLQQRHAGFRHGPGDALAQVGPLCVRCRGHGQSEALLVRDYETGIQLVIDGEADALIADFLICNQARWRHPNAELLALRPPFTVEPLGIALPPDAPLFLNLVSNYLNTIEDTGQLTQFKARWLADGEWMSELR